MSERQWYFGENDQQCGPITEDSLRQMLSTGRLRPETLIWTDGLPNWTAASQVSTFAQVVGSVVNQGSPQGGYQQQGGQAGMQGGYQQQGGQVGMQGGYQQQGGQVGMQGGYQQGGQVGMQGGYQQQGGQVGMPAPGVYGGNALQRQGYDMAPVDGRVINAWRQGYLMVMDKRNSALPDRCIKCNCPATKPLKKTFYWYPQILWLTIFLGLLVFAIVVTVVRKSITIQFGLCDMHFAKRRKALMVGWGLFGASVLLFIAACCMGGGWLSGWTFIGAIALMIAAPIYGTLASQIVAVTKIDDNFARFGGVNPDYLASLPEFPGFAS